MTQPPSGIEPTTSGTWSERSTMYMFI